MTYLPGIFLSPDKIPKREVISVTVSEFQNADADNGSTVLQNFNSTDLSRPTSQFRPARIMKGKSKIIALALAIGNFLRKKDRKEMTQKKMALIVTNKKGCSYNTKN